MTHVAVVMHVLETIHAVGKGRAKGKDATKETQNARSSLAAAIDQFDLCGSLMATIIALNLHWHVSTGNDDFHPRLITVVRIGEQMFMILLGILLLDLYMG